MLGHFCLFSAVPESQEDKRFLVLLKVPALGKHVLFMTLDHQDLLVWTHTKVTAGRSTLGAVYSLFTPSVQVGS